MIAVNGVRVTPGHMMLTGAGAWKKAGELVLGDRLVDAEGRLPLGHTIVLGTNEYLFVARATEQPGTIELTAQRCAFP